MGSDANTPKPVQQSLKFWKIISGLLLCYVVVSHLYVLGRGGEEVPEARAMKDARYQEVVRNRREQRADRAAESNAWSAAKRKGSMKTPLAAEEDKDERIRELEERLEKEKMKRKNDARRSRDRDMDDDMEEGDGKGKSYQPVRKKEQQAFDEDGNPEFNSMKDYKNRMEERGSKAKYKFEDMKKKMKRENQGRIDMDNPHFHEGVDKVHHKAMIGRMPLDQFIDEDLEEEMMHEDAERNLELNMQKTKKRNMSMPMTKKLKQMGRIEQMSSKAAGGNTAMPQFKRDDDLNPYLDSYETLTGGKRKPNIKDHYGYCIIGAGIGGSQLGFFMQRDNRDYVIIERNPISGSFYVDYPKHRQVISINKRSTSYSHRDFNFRHDWNSLISDTDRYGNSVPHPELLFTTYTKDYYPHADYLVNYLNDYARLLQLNIVYNTEVASVTRDEEGTGPFTLRFSKDNGFGASSVSCDRVVTATGISKPHRAAVDGIEHYTSYADVHVGDDDYWYNKKVAILGGGNAALETANYISQRAGLVHLLPRSRVRFSWEEHYVGYVRAINVDFVDHYQLKSMDGIGGSQNLHAYQLDDGRYKFKISDRVGKKMDQNKLGAHIQAFYFRDTYDELVDATGFLADPTIFEQKDSVQPKLLRPHIKYFEVTEDFESPQVPDLYFAGCNMHARDYKVSSGGFIHGFRYLVEYLYHILMNKYDGVEYPHETFKTVSLAKEIMMRYNTASSLYQMFQVYGDLWIVLDNGETVSYKSVPIEKKNWFVDKHRNECAYVFISTLEYGEGFHGPQVLADDRFEGNYKNSANSKFLHPILRGWECGEMDYMKESAVSEQHIIEDFLFRFDADIAHVNWMTDHIEKVLDYHNVKGAKPQVSFVMVDDLPEMA